MDKLGNIVILLCSHRHLHRHQHPNYYCCHFIYVHKSFVYHFFSTTCVFYISLFPHASHLLFVWMPAFYDISLFNRLNHKCIKDTFNIVSSLKKSSSSFRFETIFSAFSLFVLFCSPTALNALYDAMNKSYHVTRWIMSVETTFLCSCSCVSDGYEWLCLRYKHFTMFRDTRYGSAHNLSSFARSFHLFILRRKVFTSPIFEDHRINAATARKGNVTRKNLCMCSCTFLYLLMMCRRWSV